MNHCFSNSLAHSGDRVVYDTTGEVGKKLSLIPGDGNFLVPHAFTAALFLAFLAPMIISAHLGLDPDVAFWIGRYSLLALLMPVLFVAAHVVHVMMLVKGKARKSLLYFAVIATSACLMITGGCYMSKSRYLYGQLKSEDCSGAGGMTDKFLLQEAYVEARKLYDACSTRLVKANGNTPLPRRLILQNCEEWVNITSDFSHGAFGIFGRYFEREEAFSESIKSSRQLTRLNTYLASVEANQVCGGFCSSGLMLWSPVEGEGGACSPMIGLKFVTVEHQAKLLFWSAATSGMAGLLSLQRTSKHLESWGYQ